MTTTMITMTMMMITVTQGGATYRMITVKEHSCDRFMQQLRRALGATHMASVQRTTAGGLYDESQTGLEKYATVTFVVEEGATNMTRHR